MTVINVEPTPIAVNKGGTGDTTLTNHGVMLGQGTSAVAVTAAMTDGQLLVGQSSADPLPKTVSGDGTMAASGALTITKLSSELYYKIPGWGVLLPNARSVSGITTSLSTGNVDLYTCPSNKRALILNMRNSGLPAAGSVTIYGAVYISGTYYRIGTNQTNTTSQTSTNLVTSTYILEAGERLAINVATNTGSSAFWTVIEFDSTAPVFTKKIAGTASGDQTIYTCPASTSAVVITTVPLQVSVPNIVLSAGGTGTNWKHNAVPSGGSPATANQVAETNTIGTNTISGRNCNVGLTAGDFLNVNITTNDSAQLCWVNILEMPHT
jgi:hypothetical protein